MIFYPLSILLLSKIREILIVCKQIDYDPYFSLLGDGEKFGVKIHYEFQNSENRRWINDSKKIWLL